MTFSMRYHRTRLFFLKNQILILYCVLLFGWTFSLILGLIVASRVQEVAKRLEDGQKGQTCILLIQPEDRTKQNVTNCVNNNRRKSGGKDKPFNFNDNSSTPKPSPVTNTINNTQPAEPIVPPKSQPPTIVPSTPEPQILPPVVSEPVRQIETTVIDGVTKWRYVNDTIWRSGTPQ